MVKLVDFLITLSLFIGVSMRIACLGYPAYEDSSGVFHKLLPSAYMFILFFLMRISQIQITKSSWKIIGLITFFYAYRVLYLNESFNIILSIFNSWGVYVCSVIWIEDVRRRRRLNNVLQYLLLLFVLECLLAIYERITHSLIFPYSLYKINDVNGLTDGEWFRANSLLGHPLTNAFVVSVLMSFILVSNLRKKIKISLYLLGCVAILCFNARGALLFNAFFYFIYTILNSGASIKIVIKNILIFILLLLVCTFFVVHFGFGDRIFGMSQGTEDGSTMARVEALSYLFNSDSLMFFRGIGLDAYGYVHVENWFLAFCLMHGVFLAIVETYIIVKLCFHSARHYDTKDKLLLLGVFFTVASTNNSLASNSPALPIFLISCNLFLYRIQIKQNNNEDKSSLCVSV